MLLVASFILSASCGADGLNQSSASLRGGSAVLPTNPLEDCDSGCGTQTQTNDLSCPTYWAGARLLCGQGTICPKLGMTCSYPNSGDGTADGGWSTAMMFCTDLHALSSGLDAGTGLWTCAQ